ncbi:Aspartate aminotransferase, cytoplasmic [Hondaea fermentalgiana]|uniref:Aspartate aminotransferase n=1 Tax=Hondaea fermentalgiana TaxID=2315210 RepID=A0A2R5GJR2_9STRA|nr:Aspartate aminotransferase, cytoplasmic [Hondaea fermentalgiana]|eukprot:GBG28521.1 Aspartate aminotransferase, cytoplasmic [Hondaea fermentalgiana]
MAPISFEKVEQGPPDAILGVKTRFLADDSPESVNVSVGAYRDAQGKPLVLEVVRKAEKAILEDASRNKEYLGIAGDVKFRQATQEFCFGADAKSVKEGRVATVQALSGTGALRVGAEFLATHFAGTKVYIPNPTWGNHFKIFGNAGLETAKYTYLNPATRGLDFEGMMKDLEQAPAGSVVVLHVCAHNPTGVDPTAEQWQKIVDLLTERQLLPFFDSAYQGFASGDVDKDAYAVRLFESKGQQMMVAQSYSKNMGLYGERVGALNVVCPSAGACARVMSQLELVIRPMYSNPPRHGAAIAALILTDPKLREEWKVELKGIVDRILAMRKGLREAIEATGAPGDWSFITDQIGMFTFTGLSADQVASMEKNYHIYMPSNGRISVAGLTSDKLEHVAKAIRSVL